MNKPVILPPSIPDSASGAEKKIFEELKVLPMDCTIFHSVGLSEHKNNAYGEIDVVILSECGVLGMLKNYLRFHKNAKLSHMTMQATNHTSSNLL